MQREYTHLDARPHHEKGEANKQCLRVEQLRQEMRHVSHIERAGEDVKIPCSQEVGTSTNGPKEDVPKGGEIGAPFPHGNDGIGRERGNFQQHIEIEHITRSGDTEETCYLKEEEGVKLR